MHPIKFLWNELYRDYWGIPANRWGRNDRRDEAAWWRPARKHHADGRRR